MLGTIMGQWQADSLECPVSGLYDGTGIICRRPELLSNPEPCALRQTPAGRLPLHTQVGMSLGPQVSNFLRRMYPHRRGRAGQKMVAPYMHARHP